jgi:hypothetical protein
MMEAVRTSETTVDNHFTRQCNPEDSSEHHTRRRENLKSHKHTLLNRSQQETILKFYKISAVSALLYSSECWTLTIQQLQQIEFSEMRFLRSVSGYGRTDKKRNADIRKKIKNIQSRIEKGIKAELLRTCQPT